MFLGLTWYWWLVLIILLAISIPLKIKLLKWWEEKQRNKSRAKKDKWGDEE